MVVAESWLRDSHWMQPVATQPQGMLLVEGQSTEVFIWPDGRRVQGHACVQRPDWPWRATPWEPRGREARLPAPSPTSGEVTVVIVAAPGQDRSSLWWRATSLSAPWLMRRWRRRPWSACVLRTLQHLVATEACQVHSAAAYSGHLVWRLMASFVLFQIPPNLVVGS